MSRRARQIRHNRIVAAQKKVTPVVEAAPTPAPQEEVVEVEPTPEPEVAEVLAEVQADGVVTEEEEEELRQLAKSKGVSHWWSKSVERLQLELAELEG